MKAVKHLIDWGLYHWPKTIPTLKLHHVLKNPPSLNVTYCIHDCKVKVYWINQSQKHIFCGPEFI